MHYFLLIYFNNKPLHVSSKFVAHHQEVRLCIHIQQLVLSCVVFTGCWQDPDIYHLLFIQSWSSWWWAASLLETRRGILLKLTIEISASCWFILYGPNTTFYEIPSSGFIVVKCGRACRQGDVKGPIFATFLWVFFSNSHLILHVPCWFSLYLIKEILFCLQPKQLRVNIQRQGASR
jgi:hypothetical protein